jgi:GxxExxY protein
MTTKRVLGLAEETVTRSIIGAFFEVYNALGYGFLESVYTEALTRELRRLGHHVEREVMVRIWYKGEVIARQRVDMIVDGSVIVEIKAGLALHTTAPRQLYNYLRATDKEVGLLLHFGPEAKYFREYCPNSRKERQSDVSGSVREIRSLTRQEADSPVSPVGDAFRL